MKKKVYFISAIIFLLTIPVACIPVKTVKSIDTYELVKPKKQKRKRRSVNTKYRFSNYGTQWQFIQFLKTKYELDKVEYSVYYIEKLFDTMDTVFEVKISFFTDSNKYLSLVDLLSKREEVNITIEEGVEKYFIEITVVDNLQNDALMESYIHHDKVVDYLYELKGTYNSFRKKPFYIEPEKTKIKN